MMVVVAGGEQDHVDPDLAGVGGHGESQGVAVEAQGALEVGHAEVDVADADGGVDGVGVHGRILPPPGTRVIRAITYPRHGSSAMIGACPAPLQPWSDASASWRPWTPRSTGCAQPPS